MSHLAPCPGSGVAAGIQLAGGTLVTWVWLPKKGCSELGCAACTWLWVITHVALLTDLRSSHFQQGQPMVAQDRVGESSCHPRPLQWQGGQGQRVTTARLSFMIINNISAILDVTDGL